MVITPIVLDSALNIAYQTGLYHRGLKVMINLRITKLFLSNQDQIPSASKVVTIHFSRKTFCKVELCTMLNKVTSDLVIS